MKKAIKIIVSVLLLALLAAVVVLVLRFYPAYKGAGYMQEHMSLQNMTFDVTVTLSEEQLTEEQKKLITGLSEIVGMPEEDLMVLRLKGTAYGKTVLVQVMPKGWSEPLTELYLGENADLVNGAMLYNSVRDNLCEKNALAELLIPEWKGGEYLTLEQTEQMFGLDLTSAKEVELTSYEALFSRNKFFVLLAVMDHEKNQDKNPVFSGTVKEDTADMAQWEITLQEADNQAEDMPKIEISCNTDNLPELLGRADALLEKMGVEYSFAEKKGLQKIQKLEVDMAMGNVSELAWPDSLVSQDTVEKIATIRLILQGL